MYNLFYIIIHIFYTFPKGSEVECVMHFAPFWSYEKTDLWHVDSQCLAFDLVVAYVALWVVKSQVQSVLTFDFHWSISSL